MSYNELIAEAEKLVTEAVTSELSGDLSYSFDLYQTALSMFVFVFESFLANYF